MNKSKSKSKENMLKLLRREALCSKPSFRAGMLTMLVVSALLAPLKGAEAQLVDRLLVNVDSQNYSQRQFELYMALESLLFTAPEQSSWQVTPANWNEKLAVYVNHMLVDHSARSLETFTARPNEVLVAQKKLAQLGDDSWQRFIDRLGFSKSAIATERDRMIRVAKFVCHRFRLSQGDSNQNDRGALARRSAPLPTCKDGQKVPLLSKDYRWFHRVVQETPFRVYDGARTYQPLLAYPKPRAQKAISPSKGQVQKGSN